MNAEETELLPAGSVTQDAVAEPRTRQTKYFGESVAEFDSRYKRKEDKSLSFCDLLRTLLALCCGRCTFVSFVEQHLPVVRLFRTYKIRQYLPGDILSGLSVGVMTIPQSMGYALLAAVPPQLGLYTSLFPVIIYFLFGTSRHVSIGTMALSSLVIRSAVQHGTQHLKIQEVVNTTSNVTDSLMTDSEELTLKIAMSVSLTAGLIMFVMSLFRLGFIVTYMSDSFISGYLAACNILVLTHQLKLVLGIATPARGSAMEFFYLVYDICRQLLGTNLLQLLMSVVTIVVLVVVKQCVNERFKSRLKIPIPVDLIVVIIATLISYFCALEQHFNVQVVKTIPQGIPVPVIPSPTLMYEYLFEGVMLAIVSYMMVAMMAVLFAQRHDYNIDNNQELAANGLSCIGGAFFNSLAASTSPPRCFLMESTGGKTQLSYIVSAILVLVTLLAIAPLFYCLPKCILGSIVIVACIPLFPHYYAWMTYWRTDYYDLSIWIVSCFGTFFAGVDLGLLIGVGFSVFVVHFRMQRAKMSKLSVNNDDFVFLESDIFCRVAELNGVAIFRFTSPLYFATLASFKQQLYSSTVSLVAPERQRPTVEEIHQNGNIASGQSPATENKQNIKKSDSEFMSVTELAQESGDSEVTGKKDVEASESLPPLVANGNNNTTAAAADNEQTDLPHTAIRSIIVDCSSIAFLDTGGARLLAALHAEYGKRGVVLALAGCSDAVLCSLRRVEACRTLCDSTLYPSVHSALLALRADLC